MHDTLVTKVVRRYLAAAKPLTEAADSRFTPPRGVLNGVETGDLPKEVLNIWRYVSERLGDRFAFDAAIKYWRNKCGRMGIELPKKYVEGLGGKGGAGRWAVTPGDQIEEWVKMNLTSEGLIDDLGRSVYDWSLWIEHYDHKIEQAMDKIDKHSKALSKAKSEAGVAQKTKWLNAARQELNTQTDELAKARKAMDALMKAAERHDKSKSPTIEFEKEFQFLVMLAMKEFDKAAVRKAVDQALERVEQGIDIPGGDGAFNAENYEPGFKSAGLFETLNKAWDFLVSKFNVFTDWLSGIFRVTDKLEAMMKAAGA